MHNFWSLNYEQLVTVMWLWHIPNFISESFNSFLQIFKVKEAGDRPLVVEKIKWSTQTMESGPKLTL